MNFCLKYIFCVEQMKASVKTIQLACAQVMGHIELTVYITRACAAISANFTHEMTFDEHVMLITSLNL